MKQLENLTILAIETSCDDTCVSIVKCKNKRRRPKSNFEILSNLISSQVKLHAKYGGVYPSLAKRGHQKNLPLVFKKALRKARNPKIDLIAITVGPGLDPCLWIGVNFAKELSQNLNLPIVPLNHIEGHIYANWLHKKQRVENKKQIFSSICLIVSGGHTQLILMKNHGQYKIIGETRDDAAGECFDKTARILGLEYPGGPAIEAKASMEVGSGEYEETEKKKSSELQTSDFRFHLPRPMIFQKNYDFSFSGLKTAVLYDFKSRSPKIRKSKTYIREISKEIQSAIIDVLIYKTLKAVKEYKVKSLILGGGVVANKELKKQFQSAIKNQQLAIEFLVPPKIFCTDNAAMIAVAAYFHWQRGKVKDWKKIEAKANLRLG